MKACTLELDVFSSPSSKDASSSQCLMFLGGRVLKVVVGNILGFLPCVVCLQRHLPDGLGSEYLFLPEPQANGHIAPKG